MAEVKHKVSGCCVFSTVVYATNRAMDRSLLWGMLKVHEAKVTGPWIALGDWNMVRANHGKKGGKRVSQILLDEFNGAIYDIKMEDLPTNNGDWSWCNKQGVQTRINAKLDRVLVNSAWLHSFTDSKVYLIAAFLYDHYGMDVHLNFVSSLRPKPFKFLKIWCMQEEVKEVVATSWNIGVSGSPLHVLQKKLREVKKAVKEWNGKRGMLSDQVQIARGNLIKIQMDLMKEPFNSNLISQEKDASGTLQHQLELEEILWAQKSRVKWLKEGDKCTSFFYNLVKQRRCHNAITALENTKGEKSNDPKVIKEWLVEYYTDLYNDVGGVNEEILEPRKRLTQAEGISAEEIKAVVMQFSPDKAPAFQLDFFKNTGGLLSSVLPNLIGPEQSAFIKGRRLHDNFWLISDLVKKFGRKNGDPTIALKIDLKKAYDSVDWGFLQKVLLSFGFSEKWISWVIECTSTTNFSILCNGVPAGFFSASKGLRQGCPLSPLLFAFVTEYFSNLIVKAIEEGKIKRCKVVLKTGLSISHAFYADDLVMVVKADVSTLKGVEEVLQRFKISAGLQVNKDKSSIIFSKAVRGRRRLARILNFQVESFLFRYLGLPLSNNLLRSGDYRMLLDKVDARLRHWNTINLSLAGRLELIKSVLFSYLYHWLFGFKIPWEVKNMLERRFKKFLWSGKQEIRKMSQLKWSKVTLPVGEGGFNIRRIIDIDRATKMNMYSDVWKHILGMRDLILDKALFQVGDGNHFKLLIDPWCNDHSLIQLFGAARFRGLDWQTKLASIIDHVVWSLTENLEFTQNVIQQVIIHEGSDQIKWKDGLITWKVEYEWKPQVYKFCKKMDHLEAMCPLNKAKPLKLTDKWVVKPKIKDQEIRDLVSIQEEDLPKDGNEDLEGFTVQKKSKGKSKVG
ncbi:uncharacterized protein LOC132285935 [Cornus florida]|uniref:uncharacterized protein LOC132285935 n=1 Tax=Cornus florida TaxID=4283 RepID=UPI0028A01E0F|nr:uncharacterized protein LOC132285935 [Cornus florida]